MDVRETSLLPSHGRTVGYIHGTSVIVYKTPQKSQLILKDLFNDHLYRDFLELYILTFLSINYTLRILLLAGRTVSGFANH
jgi:hypothetical protein